MMKLDKARLIVACVAVAIAGWALPVSAIQYISHWDFSSDPLGEFDYTGRNDLVNSNGVTMADGAAVFDGTAREFSSRHNVDLFSTSPYTIECFALAEPDCDGIIMELGPDINQYESTGCFYIYATEGVMVKGGNRNFNGEQFDNGNICDGQWHHIAVIVDPTGATAVDQVQLYLDGVRQTKRGQYNNLGSCLMARRLYIGSRGGTSFPFKGKIDDVRITEGILSPSEFLQARSAETLNVRGYWKFNEGNALADSSGNGNVLTGSGVTVNDNGAAVFNGSQSGFATLAPLPLYAYRSMTVEWFMQSSSTNVGMVLETTQRALYSPGAFYAAANEFAGYQMTRTHSLVQDWSATDGRWHHYALVYDWDSTTYDIVRLYRDGVQVTTRKSSNSSAARLRAGTLFIGTRAGWEYPFVGQLDDIKITGRALTPAEFMAKRSSPLGGSIIIR